MQQTETATPTPAEISRVVQHLRDQGYEPLHKPQAKAKVMPEWTPICRGALRRLAAQEWAGQQHGRKRAPSVYINTLAGKVEESEEDVLSAVNDLWVLGYILLHFERDTGRLHFELTNLGRAADAARFEEKNALPEA